MPTVNILPLPAMRAVLQLPTSHGSMQGSFEFLDMTPNAETSGCLFDVTIGKFGLDSNDDVPPSF